MNPTHSPLYTSCMPINIQLLLQPLYITADIYQLTQHFI